MHIHTYMYIHNGQNLEAGENKMSEEQVDMEYISLHGSNLGIFQKIEIISSIFSDHNAMKLDINYKKKL